MSAPDAGSPGVHFGSQPRYTTTRVKKYPGPFDPGLSYSRCSSIKLPLLEVPAACGDTVSIVHFSIEMVLELVDLVIQLVSFKAT